MQAYSTLKIKIKLKIMSIHLMHVEMILRRNDYAKTSGSPLHTILYIILYYVIVKRRFVYLKRSTET